MRLHVNHFERLFHNHCYFSLTIFIPIRRRPVEIKQKKSNLSARHDVWTFSVAITTVQVSTEVRREHERLTSTTIYT